MARKPGPVSVLPDDLHDAYAIQAVAEGVADEHQQQRAIKCIVEEIAGTYAQTFDPESARMSDFNSGRRHVGRTIVNIIHANVGKLKTAEVNIAKRKQPKPRKRKR